jgi:threonine synthase
MDLYSTTSPELRASWRDAVLSGIAPDGGLFLPRTLPLLEPDSLPHLATLQFHELAYTLASIFLKDEVPASTLRSMCEESFSFPVTLVSLAPDTSILELFHGPTCAFKDFGARFMARLFRYFATQTAHEPLTVLVATSGDTGSAVANAFFDPSPDAPIKVAILFPKGKVSLVQEKQMTTLGHNVRAFEVDGTFDDCQRLVKQALADSDLTARMRLTSANSINLARLLPQMFYYVWAALQAHARGAPFFIVPSGNLGNLTGGVLAARIGIQTVGFLAACNQNDIYPHFLSTGLFNPRPSSETLSNAMDVGNPSNFPRLQHLTKGSDIKLYGAGVSDTDTLSTINSVFERTGYVLDPHTAVGVAALNSFKKSAQKKPQHAVVLATAHPAKFAPTVKRATGCEPTLPPQLAEPLGRPSHKVPLSARYEELVRVL